MYSENVISWFSKLWCPHSLLTEGFGGEVMVDTNDDVLLLLVFSPLLFLFCKASVNEALSLEFSDYILHNISKPV